ncbi:MAG: HAD hydrolase-like protein [Bacteroidetes bacterium]|nr:HAD hydrolase-like protein [Bacteroidota bacterium]
MDNAHKVLLDLKPTKEFFIGIDSDGCVYDSMEIKHKECFCPATIKYFNLQKISKYARETWEFVNLYSTTRGANRYKALLRVFELLKVRPETKSRNVNLLDLAPLQTWVETESKLGNPALAKYSAEVQDEIIDLTLRWSEEVNKVIGELVSDVPPFPYVKECLDAMFPEADLMVISQTPLEALEREWEEHNINKYVRLIAGQEYGTKSEHLKYAAKEKYDPNKILMIGDAPGDHKAAKDNAVLFFPIIPGQEEISWKRLLDEALSKFFNGTYAGEYEERMVAEFMEYLPEQPGWRTL